MGEGFGDAAPGRREAERNHLNRQRKAAQHIDPFGVVSDHNHAIGGCRHDLLPEQCPAAALDQVERGIDLVGAVNRQIEPVDVVEGGQRNAAALGLHARRLRGRNAHNSHSGADFLTQEVDEMLGGRAGAEPQPHAVAHLFQCARRRHPLQFVHGHVRARPGKIGPPSSVDFGRE